MRSDFSCTSSHTSLCATPRASGCAACVSALRRRSCACEMLPPPANSAETCRQRPCSTQETGIVSVDFASTRRSRSGCGSASRRRAPRRRRGGRARRAGSRPRARARCPTRRLADAQTARERLVERDVRGDRVVAREERCDDDPAVLGGLADLEEVLDHCVHCRDSFLHCGQHGRALRPSLVDASSRSDASLGESRSAAQLFDGRCARRVAERLQPRSRSAALADVLASPSGLRVRNADNGAGSEARVSLYRVGLILRVMRLADDGTLRLSPTDLANHLACAHLTQLELLVQRGELARPHVDDPYGQIIMRKGNEHEAAYLARLEAQGLRVLRACATYDDEGFDADEARRATEEAIRSGEADVIYQAYLSDGTWRGFADFLERLPDGTYEPVDTKLARSAKPLPRPPALLLRRAARADPGAAARARPRRARHGRARDVSDCRLHRLLPAEQGAVSGRARGRGASATRGRGRSTTARSATSATSAVTAARTTTTSSSSRGSGGCTRSGSPPRESRR